MTTRSQPLTAADIMEAEVITVTPATPLVEFARIVAEDRISGAPVVEVGGRLVGIVSKTDLVERILGDDPRYGTAQGDEWNYEGRQVADIMSDRVLTIAPNTPLGEIAARMAKDRIHRVVVLDGDRVAGIVTSIDLLAHYPQ